MTTFCRLATPLEAKPSDVMVLERASPNDYLRKLKLEGDVFQLPTVCAVSDAGGGTLFLGRHEWDMVLPKDKTCMFISYPKDPIITPAVAAFIVAHATAIVSIAAIAAYAITSLMVYSGSSKPQTGVEQKLPEARPTYDLQDQSNTIRLGQPIPVQYGRVRSYMDVASASYTEFDNATNDQFLYVFLCLGQGEYDIEQISIDDTDIDNFAEVDYNILNPGDTPTLFPTTVETSKEVGDIELGNSFVGPFVATAFDFIADRIDFDVVFPNGLHKSPTPDVESVILHGEVRKIDSQGNPIGGWISAVNTVVSTMAFEPVRRTFTWNVPAGEEGRYEARMRRQGETGFGNTVDRVDWTNLRAYSAVGHFDYGDKTMIELKIRASNQLNNENIGIFNAVATRKIQVWDGAMFNLEASRSVVWAFYDMVTNEVYGAGLEANRVDIDDLYALSQQFDAAGYHCDVRFENSISAMEALAQIGQAARCQVYQRAGKVWLVRDEPKEAVTAFFTPENIIKGTLSLKWLPRSVLAPDHVLITYFDRDTWREEKVICNIRGVVPVVPEEIRLYTITERQRAWEEGMFFAAQDRYRRKLIEFETDVEGFLPTLLDKISVAHESFGASSSGQVQRIDGNIVYLSEPANFGVAEFGYISFKNSDGSMLGPYTCSPGPSPYSIQLPIYDPVDTPIVAQEDEADREATMFGFGTVAATTIMVVTSVIPSADGRTKISGVVEDDRVHTADQGSAPERDDPLGFIP